MPPMKKSLLLCCCICLIYAASFGASGYKINPEHSNVSFKVKNYLLKSVPGTLGAPEGQIEFDPQALEKAHIKATVKMRNLSTNNAKRDRHLSNADFFEIKKFQTATFKSTEFRPGQKPNEYLIKGITHPVTFNARIENIQHIQNIEKMHWIATATLDRRTWDIGNEYSSLKSPLNSINIFFR
jgi:polyisoprenoid-binding protein YceI